MNENETENNWDTLEEVIDEFPDDTSPIVVEDFLNGELEYNNQNGFIE